jgi:DNA-binding PadR family transcriptional regulator
MNQPSDDNQAIEKHYEQLDKMFEHRTRLAICALLSRYEKMTFRRFKDLLKETDGNLGAQLRKLEDATYITVSKEFADRRPVSWYQISSAGKAALKGHLDSLDGIING